MYATSASPSLTALAAAIAAPKKISPVLPAYALDGRPLQWSPDGRAVAFDATFDEYRSDSSAVNASALKALNRSPAHLLEYMQGKRPQPTTSQRVGTAVHAAVQEPALFAATYARYDKQRRGQAWQSFKASNPGKEILNAKEWSQVMGARDAILDTIVIETPTHKFKMADLLKHGTVERVIYFVDWTEDPGTGEMTGTGLTLKARLDLMVQSITIDIKTTDDARQDAFENQCARLGYHIQSAFYRRARRALNPAPVNDPFLFVAAELDEPFATLVHEADEQDFIGVGDREVTRLLEQFKACMDAYHWPGYERPKRKLRIPFAKRLG